MPSPPKYRWRGLGSFLAILVGLFAVFRIVHVLLPPATQPSVVQVLPLPHPSPGPGEGPPGKRADDLPVRMPFYRPRSLGSEPIFTAIVDRPVRRFVALWRDEHVLALELWRGESDHRLLPEDAGTWSGFPDARSWTRDRFFCAHVREDGVTVRLCTDLSEIEARRILRSLRPLEDRR